MGRFTPVVNYLLFLTLFVTLNVEINKHIVILKHFHLQGLRSKLVVAETFQLFMSNIFELQLVPLHKLIHQ